jgi:hypothetical protein
VLFVVTMNDLVCAFDADSRSNTPLWSVDLTTQVAGSTPVPINEIVPRHRFRALSEVHGNPLDVSCRDQCIALRGGRIQANEVPPESLSMDTRLERVRDSAYDSRAR